MKLDEAINYAAEKLPKGCFVRISIEKDGYGVEIEVPDIGIRSQIISINGQSIVDDIISGTDAAIKLNKGEA